MPVHMSACLLHVVVCSRPMDGVSINVLETLRCLPNVVYFTCSEPPVSGHVTYRYVCTSDALQVTPATRKYF